MTSLEPAFARELWMLFEPVHACIYFARESRREYDAAGLKGGWMGYFASRSAAMGAVAPEVVIATFYNFHPKMVRRAIPDAWSFSSPSRVLEARYKAADEILSRLLDESVPSADVARAGELMMEAVGFCRPEGRPLFAATRAVPEPSDAHLRLWHAATCMREFRGDGHVAMLVANDVDGCEAHVLMAAQGRFSPEMQQPARGWSEQEWEAARQRLVDRGLLDASGNLTSGGVALHHGIEEGTDRLALEPFLVLGPTASLELRDRLSGIAARTAATIPYPNAMGLPPLGS